MSNNKVHIFDNNIKVFSSQLLDVQIMRYKKNNLHEPEEEKIFLELLEKIPKDGNFVNIGSAIGYYPLLAKMKKPLLQVFAYEPLKKHRKYFIKNIRLNNLNKKDFFLYKYGISTMDGIANFKKNNYGSVIQNKNEKLNIFQKLNKLINGTYIKTISMETLVKQSSGIIHLMQMDIQGHERDVLQSGFNILKGNKIGIILIGTHSAKLHDECEEILKKCDYKIIYNNFQTVLQPDGIIVGEKKL